jgi:hypothetical protein
MNIEWFDKDGTKLADGRIVKDGEKLRVPLIMADGAVVDIEAFTKAAMADDAAQPQAAMHRPGSLPILASDRAARDKALNARDKRLVDAWKHPPALQGAVSDATQRTTPAGGSAADRRDARLRDAWKMGAR